MRNVTNYSELNLKLNGTKAKLAKLVYYYEKKREDLRQRLATKTMLMIFYIDPVMLLL